MVFLVYDGIGIMQIDLIATTESPYIFINPRNDYKGRAGSDLYRPFP